MKQIRNISLALALTIAGNVYAASENAPEILSPSFTGAGVIHGLSNNGKYGVASINPGSDGFSYTVGAILYDLTGTYPVAINLGVGQSASGANDVTDDGKIVVGTVNQLPAICRDNNGLWVWETLPIPEKTFMVETEDMYTGEITLKEFSLNGGQVNAVTSDGRYAVGLVRCNEYELIEQGVMWDLSDMSIIEVDAPITNSFGQDDSQTRFLQVSDDGRYLLCWNSFSYIGSIIFIYDREKKETIYIDVEKNGDTFTPRVPEYKGIELDGISKSLTSDGHYMAGGINKDGQIYIFRFDVYNKELTIYDDSIHDDATGWSVTKDGLVLGATPAITPYADGLVCYDDFLYPFETIYTSVYGMNLRDYGIDNTGKPTLVSDDGRTIVFVTEQTESYVARFKEDLVDCLDRINIMGNWSVSPAANTRMSKLQEITLTFDNPIELNSSLISDVKLLDPNGEIVAVPKAENGVGVNNMKLIISFNAFQMNEGETYTVAIPEGLCYLKGHPGSVNDPITVSYIGRGNAPVAVRNISPENGSSLANLDINDNPVVVTFDVPVKINGTAENRPTANIYIDGSEESAASLSLDVDLYTNSLVIYPAATYYLYKGSEYKISIPTGVVTDLSGEGASEAFAITYIGTYVPQLGDEVYVFKSGCDDYTPFLFYEGDHGEPRTEYQEMGFTSDTTPWMMVMDDENSTDMAFASHSSYKDGRRANDWVATRQLKLPADVNTYLSFQSQSYLKAKTDVLKVYVYVNEVSYNQLTSDVIEDILENGDLVYEEVQSPGATEAKMAGEWTDNVLSLEPYKGKSIYICFLNDNQYQSMIMIDNIHVVKEINSFITITGSMNVVDQESTMIKGMITVQNELANYSDLSMTLFDNQGNEVSKIIESELSLTGGDIYNFQFPNPLPLLIGEENRFMIRYTLGEENMEFEGMIRDLAFQPERRIVIEEYTGRDCQFCPLGIAAMERLESLYGHKIIPVVLHAYNGSDPKGANMLEYAAAVFMNSTSAPNGRINRRPNFSDPMYRDENNVFHLTATDIPGIDNLWFDDVVEELNEPAFLDIDITGNINSNKTQLNYTATVRSALNLEEQNIRVLGVLMEDGLLDRQTNGIYNYSDPLLGEFGQGGIYGSSTFRYIFNNVAKGYWGQSINGTARLIPSSLEVGKEYNVEINYDIPSIVANTDNVKMAVILIDENTGKVINAAVAGIQSTGVDSIVEGSSRLAISKIGGQLIVDSDKEVMADVYTMDGKLLKSAVGYGQISIDLGNYRGMVVVKAYNKETSLAKKILM